MEDVWLMRQVNKFIGIKAAGGIRDAFTAVQMMLAAECFDDNLVLKGNLSDIFRIGASSGKAIVDDFRKRFGAF